MGILSVDWHDFVALLVRRSVQRNRQLRAAPLRCASRSMPGNDAAGRKRRVLGRDCAGPSGRAESAAPPSPRHNSAAARPGPSTRHSSAASAPRDFPRAQSAPAPTISPAVKLRIKPSVAVRQKWQSTAQPACVDMQIVCRFSSGMNTVSTVAGFAGRASRGSRRGFQRRARSALSRPTNDSVRTIFGSRSTPRAPNAFPQRERQIAHRAHIELPLRIQRVINLPAAIGRLAQARPTSERNSSSDMPIRFGPDFASSSCITLILSRPFGGNFRSLRNRGGVIIAISQS